MGCSSSREAERQEQLRRERERQRQEQMQMAVAQQHQQPQPGSPYGNAPPVWGAPAPVYGGAPPPHHHGGYPHHHHHHHHHHQQAGYQGGGSTYGYHPNQPPVAAAAAAPMPAAPAPAQPQGGGRTTEFNVDAEGWQQYDPSLYNRHSNAQFVDDEQALAAAIARSLASAEEERGAGGGAPPALPRQASAGPLAGAAVFTTGENEPFNDADLQLMPRVRYVAGKAQQDDEMARQCTLCFEEYDDAAELMMLPCFHRFHWSCAADWLKRKPLCPVCKANAKHTGGSTLFA